MFKYGYIKAYSLYTSIYELYFVYLWCELMTLNNDAHHRYIAVYKLLFIIIHIYGPYINNTHQNICCFINIQRHIACIHLYKDFISYIYGVNCISIKEKPDSFLSGFKVYNSITSSFLMAFSFTAAIMASLLSACSILIRSSTFW